MGDLIEMAMSAISQAQRRVEIAAQNLGNATTPSYKRRVAFSTLIAGNNPSQSNLPQLSLAVDQRQGKLIETGNPTNLALSGPGYFALRRDEQLIYTRNGQLSLDGEGRLVDRNGFALQLSKGGDLVVKSAAFVIGPGGVAREKGEVLGTVAVYALDREAAALSQPEQRLQLIENPEIRQGMIEASNVSTGDEMVAMIEALRRAEAGQRAITVYDDLIGRVINSFGDSAR